MGLHKKKFITFMYMNDRQWPLKCYLNCGATLLAKQLCIFFRVSLHNHLKSEAFYQSKHGCIGMQNLCFRSDFIWETQKTNSHNFNGYQ